MSTNYAALIEKQKQFHHAQLEALSSVDLATLEAEKQKHFDAIAQIDEKISAVLRAAGITTEKRAKIKKTSGIIVSFERLMELFKEHKTKELNVRSLKLDTKQIKKIIADNPSKLELKGKGAWPIIVKK